MKYVRRLMWYIASRALALTVIASLLVCAFYMCMNTANIYIVLTDGLKSRVDAILTGEGAERLNDYFHAEFLNQDAALIGAFDGTSAFGAYDVTNYRYLLTIDKLWAWPWDDTANSTVTERVPSITATVKSSRRGDVTGDTPVWQGGKYTISLSRSQGKWKITGMKQIGIIMEAEPTPTPVPTASPAP